ncbi:MAG: hypothetical protein ACK4KW_00480 [Gemmobacter sp.]
MTMTSIGDLARSLTLQRTATAAKGRMNALIGALGSGRTEDPGRALRADLGPVAAMSASLARIEGWRAAALQTGQHLSSMQQALDNFDRLADALSGQLIAAASGGSDAVTDLAAREARESFEALIGTLNARAGGRSLFAGAATEGPALAPAAAILAELAAATAGAVSAADAKAAIDAWFSAPAGFGATGYRGSAALLGPVGVGPDSRVMIDVTAADPALRDTLAAAALAALVGEGLFAGQPDRRRAALLASGTALIGTAEGRAGVAGRIGLAENRVAAATARNEAEASGLAIARAGLLEADPFATATELEAVRTQIEMIHALTARVSRLSLLDHLR